MLRYIGLKNYRTIKSEFKFDIKPITLLIGANNSGKSSLIKSLLLIQHNSKNIEKLITSNGLHKLGAFQSVINRNSNDDFIEFTLPSYFFGPVVITLKYTGENNKINNGRISEIIFRDEAESAGCLINIYNIEYNNNNSLLGYQFFINYHEILQKIKELEDLNTSKDNNSRLLIFRDKIHPFLKSFNSNKSIFKYKRSSGIEELVSNDVGLILDSELLTLYSVGIEQPHPDEDSILSSFTDSIYRQYYGENNRASSEMNNFKEKHGLNKILPTENGEAFFLKIKRSIEDVFNQIDYAFHRIKYISSAFGNQQRIYTDKQDVYFSEKLARVIAYNESKNMEYLNYWLKTFNMLKNNEVLKLSRIVDFGFEISVEEQSTHALTNIADCGYGVMQMISLLIGLCTDGNSNRYDYIIEEPEANLHPEMQSKLADLFSDKCINSNLIIETHSEYLIRKFQYLVASGSLKHDNVVIHNFWIENDEHRNKVININSDGTLSDSFERGFYDESVNQKFELLKLIKSQKN